MQVLNNIIDILNWVAVHVPWAMVGASALISPLLVGIKKWFSVQSEKVMITLVGLVSMAAAGFHYLLTVPTHNPSVIAIQGFVLAFMTQPVYFFAVKPSIAWLQKRIQEAAELNLAKSAAEPVEDLSH